MGTGPEHRTRTRPRVRRFKTRTRLPWKNLLNNSMTSLFETLTQSISTYSNGGSGRPKPSSRSPGTSPFIMASSSPTSSNNSAVLPFPDAEEVACKECGKEFRDRMAWRNHQRNHKEFPCPQCDYVARRRDHLRSHVLTRHENDKPYKCSECDFSTVYHSNYKNHMAMHSEQRSKLDGSSQQQDAGFGEASEWISSIFEYVDDSTANATAPSPPSGSAKGSATSVEKFVIIPSEQAPPKRKRSKRWTIMAPVVTTASNGTPVSVDKYFASPPCMPKAEEISEISQLAQALGSVSPTPQVQCQQLENTMPQLQAHLGSIPTPEINRSAAAAAGLSSFMEHASENAALRRQLAEKDAEIAQMQREKRDAAANTDLLLARIEQLEKQLDTRNQLVTKLTLKLNGMDDD